MQYAFYSVLIEIKIYEIYRKFSLCDYLKIFRNKACGNLYIVRFIHLRNIIKLPIVLFALL